MSKAVLIMDMPKCCWRCKLSRKVADNDWDRVCCPAGVYMDFHPPMLIERPEWCPLRKLPERKPLSPLWSNAKDTYENGWNACLDVIMEED